MSNLENGFDKQEEPTTRDRIGRVLSGVEVDSSNIITKEEALATLGALASSFKILTWKKLESEISDEATYVAEMTGITCGGCKRRTSLSF